MAREYARVKVSIWDDGGDFNTLTPAAKLLYIHLFSRRDLSLAGHLFIREQRWADACFGGNVDAIRDAIAELIANRYTLADTKTGELLIRTFIRHDGGWRNPKMRKAIESAIDKMESPELSTVATDALARCVKGDPDPEKPLVERQSDYQPDDQSDTRCDDQPDQVSDPTCSLTSLHPYNSSSSSSELHSEPPRPEDEEDEDLISVAMTIVADRLTARNANGDAFSYRRKVLADQTRINDLRQLHEHHPDFNAEQLAALHGGRELARVIAMTEPQPQEPPWPPVTTYTPPPEPEPVPYCDGCDKPAALMRLIGCKDPDPPAGCVYLGATVHAIRPETA